MCSELQSIPTEKIAHPPSMIDWLHAEFGTAPAAA
jgi:hypothetical protein